MSCLKHDSRLSHKQTRNTEAPVTKLLCSGIFLEHRSSFSQTVFTMPFVTGTSFSGNHMWVNQYDSSVPQPVSHGHKCLQNVTAMAVRLCELGDFKEVGQFEAKF